MKAGMTIIGLEALPGRSSPAGQEASHVDSSAIFGRTENQCRNGDPNLAWGAIPQERRMQFMESIIMIIFLFLSSSVFLLLACFECYLHPNRCGDAARPLEEP
jgi:hypothetical protein